MGNLMRKTEMIPIWYFGLFSKKKKGNEKALYSCKQVLTNIKSYDILSWSVFLK